MPSLELELELEQLEWSWRAGVELEQEGAIIADKLLYEDMPAVPGIGMLIGADHLWKFLTGEVQRCEENQGFAAINTTFGWTFQGPFSVNTSFIVAANACVLKIGVDTADGVETTLQKFWELDAIGISDKPQDHKTELSDIAKITKKAVRYEVALPWKEEASDLADNRNMAVQRLRKLTKKLSRNKELTEEYDKAIRGYLESGHAERVTESATLNPVYYMPHQPVIRNDSTSTRLRVVFDASSHAPGKSSLNEHLEKGPNLISDLGRILLRFRLHRVALVADIEKPFLQIEVQPEDRDALRFLWYSRPPLDATDLPDIEEWRITRVPFGTTAPLPSDRMNCNQAFGVVGIDFAGPCTQRRETTARRATLLSSPVPRREQFT